MLKYKVNVCGCVYDTDTDFKCGFDITVENGGSVANVGMAIQGAIDEMKDEGHPYSETTTDKGSAAQK